MKKCAHTASQQHDAGEAGTLHLGKMNARSRGDILPHLASRFVCLPPRRQRAARTRVRDAALA